MGKRKSVTMMEIAEHTGVSIATVARVIHDDGYVSREIRERVEKAKIDLGYKEKIIEYNKSNLIGVCIPDGQNNPFFSVTVSKLAEVANDNGMYILPKIGEPSSKKIKEVINEFVKLKVSGIVILGFSDPKLSKSMEIFLHGCEVPIVFIERTAGCYGLNRVLLNGEASVYTLTKHLIDNGHKNLLYIAPASENEVDLERMTGYKNALKTLKIYDPPTVFVSKDIDTIKSGYIAATKGLNKWPETTAIVAWSDLFAIGAMRYCKENDIKIPEDIAIAGFDGIYAPYSFPPLTSIELPIKEMAEVAVEIVIENSKSSINLCAKTLSLTPKLIIRESTDKKINSDN